jgi:hypothetical protein
MNVFKYTTIVLENVVNTIVLALVIVRPLPCHV